ncbi:TPA: hypothetical protein QDB01_005183 [Burkholderia vietnamiensis]|nr:hypothetical protein [Burkholderia vietnamiensis]
MHARLLDSIMDRQIPLHVSASRNDYPSSAGIERTSIVMPSGMIRNQKDGKRGNRAA